MINNICLKTAAIIALMSLAACKKPVASFTTAPRGYFSGETIDLTNTSTHADSYRWTLPDGQISTAKNISYTIPSSVDDQQLTFKLEAISKNGKNTNSSVQNFYALANQGRVTLYSSAAPGTYSIQIDGHPNSSYYFGSTIPTACNQPGQPTFTLTAGYHQISASNGTTTTYLIAVSAGICSFVNIQ